MSELSAQIKELKAENDELKAEKKRSDTWQDCLIKRLRDEELYEAHKKFESEESEMPDSGDAVAPTQPCSGP